MPSMYFHILYDFMGARTQEAIARRNSRLLELARGHGVQLADLRWSHDEFIVTWKNCQSASNDAVANGTTQCRP